MHDNKGAFLPWLWDMLLARQLDATLRHPEQRQFAWLRRFYGYVAIDRRQGLLRQRLPWAQTSMWHLINPATPPELPADLIAALRAAAQLRSDQRPLALHILLAGVRHGTQQIWPIALDLLLEVGEPQAIAVAQELLHEGDPDPIWRVLEGASANGYPAAARALAAAVPAQPGLRNAVVRFFKHQIRAGDSQRAPISALLLAEVDESAYWRLAQRDVQSQSSSQVIDATVQAALSTPLHEERQRAITLLGRGLRDTSAHVWNWCVPALVQLARAPLPATDQTRVLEQIASGIGQSHADLRNSSLAALVSLASLPPIRAEIVRLIADYIPHPDPAIWCACLRRLAALDLAAALTQSKARLVAGRPAPFCCLLKIVDHQNYQVVLLAFVEASKGMPVSCRMEVVAAFREIVTTQPYDRAAIALLGLIRQAPDEVAGLVAQRRAEIPARLRSDQPTGMIGRLLTLGEQPGLRPDVEAVLRRALHVPADSALRSAKLADDLFPFEMPEMLAEGGLLYLEEALHAPDTSVAGWHISAWAYHLHERASHMLLTGHANAAICVKVTARLVSTIMEQRALGNDDWLLVLGACWITFGENSAAAFDPLWNALNTLRQSSGMIHMYTADQPYAELCHQVQERMLPLLQTYAPVMLHPEAKAGADPVILPLYPWGHTPSTPLQFELPLNLFGPELPHLLKAQRAALHQHLINDALRRQLVYREWRATDEIALHHRLGQIFTVLAPTSSATERAQLLETSYQTLLAPNYVHTRNRTRYDRFQQPLIARWLAHNQQITTWAAVDSLHDDDLDRLVDQVLTMLPPALQDALYRDEALLFRDLIARSCPSASMRDDVWQARLHQLLQRDVPVRGRRNYPDATIDSVARQASETTSLLATAFALPTIVREDIRWYDETERLLRTIDERQHALVAINLGILLDAFLRGWPPEMIADTRHQQDYRDWCKAQRATVWSSIHQMCCRQGLRIDPLIQGNVVFAVRAAGAATVCVTPYVIAAPQSLSHVFHPQTGLITHLDPWDYRMPKSNRIPQPAVIAQDNRGDCMSACDDAERALLQGDLAAALSHFRQALCQHPLVATQRILRGAWDATWGDTSAAYQARLPLATAVERFVNEQQAPDETLLCAFNERYPLFLADPYALLAYTRHTLSKSLAAAKAELDELQRATPELPVDWMRWQNLAAHMSQSLWHYLDTQHDPDMEQSYELCPDLIETLKTEGGYRPSDAFMRHVGYLAELPRADQYQAMKTQVQALLQKAEAGAWKTQPGIDALRIDIEQLLLNMAIEPAIVRALVDLCARLTQPVKPNDEARLRGHFQTINARLMEGAHTCAKTAAQVHELTQGRQLLAQIERTLDAYRYALARLTPDSTMPLMGSSALPSYQIEAPKLQSVYAINVDTASQTIWLKPSRRSDEGLIVQIKGGSSEDLDAIKAELERPEIAIQLDTDPSGFIPHYGVLLVALPSMPRAQAWRSVMRHFEPSLITIVAYHPTFEIRPLGQMTQAHKRLLTRYDHSPVIDRIDCSIENMIAQLRQIYPGIDQTMEVAVGSG